MVSGMAQLVLSLAFAFFLVASSARAAVVEHTFNVGNLTVNKLCQDRVITAVNEKLPGPTILAKEGDTVIVHVNNNSPYNITIHWHGIYQLLTAWADGPNYITQCPIVPGRSYAYNFTITGQEGTLWWHAHASILRATVYGALIIRPRAGSDAYPFPKPHKEIPIILGEWWNANVVDVENAAFLSGQGPTNSDAYTINGSPGDLYMCSYKQTYKLEVVQGETYMLRIINAALNNQLFFKVANHSFTVVAVDASYTMPYKTDVIVIAPGQTVDALMVADASPSASYYMAARAYASAVNLAFDSTTTTGIVQYKPVGTNRSTTADPPVMPSLPDFFDTPTAYRFYTNLTALIKPASPKVPLHVDERMFVTIGLGFSPCGAGQTACMGQALSASMNNVSFAFPTRVSLLEAQFKGTKGIYTSDFPNMPPLVFDYTNQSMNTDPAAGSLSVTPKGTKVKKVKYGAVVEMVLQNTALLAIESHPMHLHGFDFFVLAQGFGNYNASTDVKSYNLVNPQVRNTIAVPTGGWSVIRFKANNPGMWFMHCHLDVHLTWGMAMAFEVENGPDAASTLPPPPPDFPTC
ncbi:laccase-25-like precursor [Iris pallida]|uniref:Laccase n=1 Tax=Iris pallida TaxID=29817 RepID=A0AAX6E3J4_IRIPA|nr:laccase-25-like precursor [Iris pallida]